MSGYIAPSWKESGDWQRRVSGQVNPILQGYIWQQYNSAPSPDPNEAYSYYDLTKSAPGWFDGTNWYYYAGVDDSGNLAVAGTLTVTGATILSSTLGVTGATTLSSLGVTGNATVGGTFGVTGATTLSTLACGAVTGSGSITTTGAVGYRTGAGGTVNQATSQSTGVTVNAICGRINLVSAAGTTSDTTFTVTNSQVDSADVVIVSQRAGANNLRIDVTAIGSGSFDVTFSSDSTAVTGPSLNFAVIKAVTS